ncbi:hypothetical protein Micbo1qcDRAFT_165488 [Microdochium bolleyi]|uniref:GAT domain-containing protein n=1 Tax=Microdochium bolleyi TaxID=196109 RepID=A0A136IXB5_9PEZI|nr:hypothetical protein Micbo1qcDRAFT_165488 [Microdochium bolleyi]
MKSLKKIKASISRKTSGDSNGNTQNGNGSGESIPRIRADTSDDPQGDGPEAVAARNVRLFCESGAGPNSNDDYIYLPAIVDAAESSPEAAAECARVIRQYLRKAYKNSPSFQYNAIMLMRILTDNPGPTFTRNLDVKFVETCKAILNSPDRRVNQIMMDTLDAFEHQKAGDEGLGMLIIMWQGEKQKALQKSGGAMPFGWQPPSQHMQTRAPDPHSQNYFARQHAPRRTLPDPVELAGRLEEARTSAKVLHDIVANTPPQEVLGNELIKEFADRCLSASRSIQGYMSATQPAPDHETMESLIDTNEQLQASMSLHQRAMLNARKQAGLMTPQGQDEPSPVTETNDPNVPGSRRYSPVSEDEDAAARAQIGPRPGGGKGKHRDLESSGAAGISRSHTPRVEDDPFKDPEPEYRAGGSSSNAASGSKGKARHDDDGDNSGGYQPQRLFDEPFHPGFGTTTPSYLGRQESAVGKEAMSGAAGGSSSLANRAPPPPPSSAPAPHESDDRPREPTYRY